MSNPYSLDLERNAANFVPPRPLTGPSAMAVRTCASAWKDQYTQPVAASPSYRR